MCQFFSCVITDKGQVLWSKEDHHHDILNKTVFEDRDLGCRFICAEIKPETNFTFELDAPYYEPDWLTDEMKEKAVKLAQDIWVIWADYTKFMKQSASTLCDG